MTGKSYGLADLLTDEASSIPPRPSRHCGGRKTFSTDETRDIATSSPVNSVEISEFEASDVSVQEETTESQSETNELNSRSQMKMFARAANLVREALELSDEEGVPFVNVSATSKISSLLSNIQATVEEDSTSAK